MRRSRREIEQAVDSLDTSAEDRREMIQGQPVWDATEPELSEPLATHGFVVERELRVHDNGYEDVLLHTTPSVPDVFRGVSWSATGPTTTTDAIRIDWVDDGVRETAIETAEYPVRHERAELPENPVVVDSGDGWNAVAPAAVTAERMVDRRSRAERLGKEVLGEAPPIPAREEYGLVEIDAPPVAYTDRRDL